MISNSYKTCKQIWIDAYSSVENNKNISEELKNEMLKEIRKYHIAISFTDKNIVEELIQACFKQESTTPLIMGLRKECDLDVQEDDNQKCSDDDDYCLE